MILGRTSSVLVSLLGTVLVLAGATGCAGDPDAGTNGVGKLPAGTIEKRARTAADAADTVRLAGTVVSRGHTYTLDMRLRGNGGLGEVTSEGSTFELLRVGDDLYLKAGAGFYGDQVGAKLKNKYVKVPTADPAYDQFSGFTDKEVLLEGLFVLHGALAVGEHRTVGGVRTIAVTADGGEGGTIDVSLEGKPYPLRYERAGGAGTLTMDDWGKDFTLRAPDEDDVVDYGKAVTQ
ncbi:hypothetical protein ABZ479_01185 [Streptomyces sp. NPDC005722]